MRRILLAVACVVAATVPGVTKHRSDIGVAGDAAEIRKIVSGKECVNVKKNGDVLKFGKSTPNVAGTFKHTGQPSGMYKLGYATMMVLRGGKLHSHVVTVSSETRMLQFSADKYQC